MMKSKSSSAKGYPEFSLLHVDMSWLCRQSNTTKKVCSKQSTRFKFIFCSSRPKSTEVVLVIKFSAIPLSMY